VQRDKGKAKFQDSWCAKWVEKAEDRRRKEEEEEAREVGGSERGGKVKLVARKNGGRGRRRSRHGRVHGSKRRQRETPDAKGNSEDWGCVTSS
jgi:hypothetical protein